MPGPALAIPSFGVGVGIGIGIAIRFPSTSRSRLPNIRNRPNPAPLDPPFKTCDTSITPRKSIVPDITRLLTALDADDPQSAEAILPLVYEELRRLAGARMAMEGSSHTLQPTALVHEAWLRLVAENHPSWKSRRLFFSAAAEAMRRILIERARRRRRLKHGGGLQRLHLDDLDLAATAGDDTLLRLDEALGKLAQVDPTGSELVRLRFYAGLSNAAAAELLGLAERTAKRTWAYARAWLYEELRRQD